MAETRVSNLYIAQTRQHNEIYLGYMQLYAVSCTHRRVAPSLSPEDDDKILENTVLL